MKKLLVGLTLLASMSSFASTTNEKCMVNIDYAFGTEMDSGAKYVGSSAGAVKGITVEEIEKLLKVALNENGYSIAKTDESRDYVLKFNYFNNLNSDGTTFGGIDLSLNGPGITSRINTTPGLFDTIFRSEEKQVENTTKGAIATIAEMIPHCY